MTKLSRALQKYYTRTNNRVIFTNGLSLNQMAWAMWEKLDYKGMDPSVLSRLINGERLFTSLQLDVFCECLRISEMDKLYLKEVLQQDLLDKFGWESQSFDLKEKYLFDLIEDDLARIERIRARDLPVLASEWVDQLHDRIQQLLPFINNSASRKKILFLLARALIERKRIDFALCDTNKELPKKILDMPRQLIKIGKEIGNSELIGNAYSVEGSIQYYKKNYIQSIKSNLKAVPLIKSGHERSIALSRLAIVYGKLKKEGEFLNTRAQIYKLLPSFSDDLQCYLLQTIAQAEIQIKYYKEAGKTIHKAWDLYYRKVNRSKEYSGIRKIQITRTELQLASAMGVKKGKNNYEKMMNQAVLLINQCGYGSYSFDISRFWEKIA